MSPAGPMMGGSPAESPGEGAKLVGGAAGIPPHAESWAERRPRRACRWERSGERVALLVPRFGKGRLGRWMDRRFAPRPYQVRLDAVGTFVWERLDGTRTVRQIAGEMEGRFGAEVAPVAERLVLFLSRLRRGRFIELGNPAGDAG